MKRVIMKRGSAITLVVLSLLVSAVALASCGDNYSGVVRSITIGMTTNEVNSLILIAQERGYFAANGLDVIHEIYTSGDTLQP